MIYDEDGQLVSASLADYVIPSAVEIPHIDVIHIESCSAVAGGFRGMGEGGTIGAPAAIANAVSDALSALDINISISTDHSGADVQAAGEGTHESERKPAMNDLTGRVALVTGGGPRCRRWDLASPCRGGGVGRGEYHSSRMRPKRLCANREGRWQGQPYQADIADLEAVRSMVAAVKADFAAWTSWSTMPAS